MRSTLLLFMLLASSILVVFPVPVREVRPRAEPGHSQSGLQNPGGPSTQKKKPGRKPDGPLPPPPDVLLITGMGEDLSGLFPDLFKSGFSKAINEALDVRAIKGDPQSTTVNLSQRRSGWVSI
ncbi:hypothetical protein BDP27DRAFT_504680 [Rhodocollybia butyracea]|uniref:Uncharacterized protein n=1 Tax=Rhodocollybia butyracea TaxID=206335 RepID=A0A9P5P8T9_9AGAR|nr:hypothetical protein BDP27DRAFT_504680 [Rhodocollybia butyracea]